MANDIVSLVDSETVVKVSSTLDKSVGKKNLTDGNIETCWTSQQGLPQFIQLKFENFVTPRRVSWVFQGGFVGTCCSVQIPSQDESTKEWQILMKIYPEDVNRRQTFNIPPVNSNTTTGDVKAIRFVFEESSDFFGRITVYDLRLEGSVISCTT